MKVTNVLDGIKPQALAILTMVQEYELEDGNYNLFTSAWYNGCERGIAITLNFWKRGKRYAITFGEVRNSDSIFVDSWAIPFDVNPPTVNDFTDEAWNGRKYFDYGQIVEAAQFIGERIEDYILADTTK